MIQKVGIELRTNKKHLASAEKNVPRVNNSIQNNLETPQINPKLLQAYYVSFGASKSLKNQTDK